MDLFKAYHIFLNGLFCCTLMFLIVMKIQSLLSAVMSLLLYYKTTLRHLSYEDLPCAILSAVFNLLSIIFALLNISQALCIMIIFLVNYFYFLVDCSDYEIVEITKLQLTLCTTEQNIYTYFAKNENKILYIYIYF